MSSPVEKKDLPFIELSVTCPMCQKDSAQRVLKDEAYSVLKLDIDLGAVPVNGGINKTLLI